MYFHAFALSSTFSTNNRKKKSTPSSDVLLVARADTFVIGVFVLSIRASALSISPLAINFSTIYEGINKQTIHNEPSSRILALLEDFLD